MDTQISIFDGTHKFVNDKPIRLIELFAGYGSQALALKYLGIPFEHHKISEWAVKSIQAYKDMHFPDDNTDYSCGMSFDNVIDYLFERGISADYNKPMTREQIKRMGERKCRTVYNNIKATHNLVSVCNIKAKDLDITDTDKFTYLLTYSFPCQDLSILGKRKGMKKGDKTRSGLLWEIERILKECDELPQVLLMENVPQIIGEKNRSDFGKWIDVLDKLGYHSKFEKLNATDFGVPQNRNRVFMVSVIGDVYYEFPQKIGCTLRLKDLLEKNVPEKYYLSDTLLTFFKNNTLKQKIKNNGFRFSPTAGENIARCVTTKAGTRMYDNFIISRCEMCGILEGDKWDKIIEKNRRVYSIDFAAPTITAVNGGNQETKVMANQGVRKLTPRECFRLMGVKDNDYERVARNQSDTSLYHLAGDSIVVNVLMAIFKELFNNG